MGRLSQAAIGSNGWIQKTLCNRLTGCFVVICIQLMGDFGVLVKKNEPINLIDFMIILLSCQKSELRVINRINSVNGYKRSMKTIQTQDSM